MKRVSRQCVHSLEGTLTEQGTVLGHTYGYGRLISSRDSDVISHSMCPLWAQTAQGGLTFGTH